MTLLERGLSSGPASVGALLDGSPAVGASHDFGVVEAIEAAYTRPDGVIVTSIASLAP